MSKWMERRGKHSADGCGRRPTRLSSCCLLAMALLSMSCSSPTLPTAESAAQQLAAEPRSGPLLDGYRWRPAPPGHDAAQRAARERTLRALQVPIDLQFDKTPLHAVLDSLGRKADLKIVANWARIREDTQLEESEPVSLALRATPLQDALDEVLRQVDNTLGWAVNAEGTLLISTDDDVDTATATLRWYDLWPVLLSPEQQAMRAGLPCPLLPLVHDAKDPRHAANVLFPAVEFSYVSIVDQSQQIERITGLIRDRVGRQQAWDTYGGTSADLEVVDRILRVRAPLAYHEQIEALFHFLEEQLHGRRISIHFEQTPLRQALAETSRLLKRNMAVNWRRMADVGVEPKTPVTLRLTEVPGLIALQLLLEQVANEATLADRNGVLVVGAQAPLAAQRQGGEGGDDAVPEEHP